MKYLIIVWCSLIFATGCMNDFQKQNFADAKAGTDAIIGHPLSAPPIQDIAKGVGSHIKAGTLLATLPAPKKTPEQIIGDPDAYKKQGAEAEKEAEGMSGGFLAGLFGLVTGVGLLVARNSGPLGSMAASLFSKLSPHASEKEKRAKTVLGVIASTEVGRQGLKKLDAKLDGESVGRILTELSGGKASTIEEYFVSLLKADQRDRNIQSDVASLRSEVLHTSDTKNGDIV